MRTKKKFLYWLKCQEENGKITKYSIYKLGNKFLIVNNAGFEQLMHPSSKTIEDEIRIVFKAKVLRTIMPGEQDL